MEPIIRVEHLCKTFDVRDNTVHAAKDISFDIERGDIFGIIGLSGAGKSTLVRCLNLLEKPTSGKVLVDGKDLMTLSGKELRLMRRDIGMIFQHFNLLMQKSVLDNVCFPLKINGVKGEKAKKRAMELLETVGLADKAHAYPAQLSGGQKQRVAIARVLANNPKILLCDEATSALDVTIQKEILELLDKLKTERNMTYLFICHDIALVQQFCDRVLVMHQGKIVEEGTPDEVIRNPKTEYTGRLIESVL